MDLRTSGSKGVQVDHDVPVPGQVDGPLGLADVVEPPAAGPQVVGHPAVPRGLQQLDPVRPLHGVPAHPVDLP